MLPAISKIKGVHPGAVLTRELRKRGVEKKQFAFSMGEYPQTISAISKGKRGINPTLSIKLGQAFGIDENYFMLLQAYYEVEQERKRLLSNQKTPNMSVIEKLTFWDTDINKIDWQRNRKAVVHRIFERGNDAEINEIIKFYGKNVVSEILSIAPIYLPTTKINAQKYLGLKL